MSIILKAENISKQYRLGLVGTGSLRHDANRWWHGIRGKEDPYLKVGAVNDRSVKASEEYVWALRDVNFEVEEGEVLGIIGKNGAGKSTLLKILSRVTSPTTGEIKTRGRIASLLEVGTGFHPELTGRENIFLNGAILGMTKNEIRSKLDEIIDFSGCEMYIDTPVKRYSSGMRVRLAFAVAAHLDPDILVVDEVLAVGDAEFQKKAIGKMQDISRGEGRTVLFVSHNMAAVKSLCTRSLFLENGKVVFNGSVDNCINQYLNKSTVSTDYIKEFETNYGNVVIELLNSKNQNLNRFLIGEGFKIKISFKNYKTVKNSNIGIGINDSFDSRIVTFHSRYEIKDNLKFEKNDNFICEVSDLNLMPGLYNLEISLFEENNVTYYNNNRVIALEIVENDFFETGKLPDYRRQGKVLIKSNWFKNNSLIKKY